MPYPNKRNSTTFVKDDVRLIGKSQSQEHKEKRLSKIRRRIYTTCDYCGKTIVRNPFEIEKRKWHFCDRRCYSLWYAKARGVLFEWSISEEGRKKLIPIWSENGKKHWAGKDKNERLEWSKSMRLAATIKPNKPERRLAEIIHAHNLPYEYVGNGKFWIEKINPDFVNCNGQKVVLEVFGDYWHNLKNVILKDKEKEEILKKYGWKRVIFWEHEIKELPVSTLLERLEI